MKQCAKCKDIKPLSDFWLDRKKNKSKPYCKECSKAAQKAWRNGKPNYEQTRYAKERIEVRERHLIRKYGVDLATYAAMLAAQNGKCDICLTPAVEQHNGVLHVDHCHASGAVRGLLCRGCNHMLGVVQDNPALLTRAIHYLARATHAQRVAETETTGC